MALPTPWSFTRSIRPSAFGWRNSGLAIARLREAMAEIRAVARPDPALGAEGWLKTLRCVLDDQRFQVAALFAMANSPRHHPDFARLAASFLNSRDLDYHMLAQDIVNPLRK